MKVSYLVMLFVSLFGMFSNRVPGFDLFNPLHLHGMVELEAAKISFP